MEPLLSAVDIESYLIVGKDDGREVKKGIDWVIVGGESGPKARPIHPNWVRDIRDQALSAGIPFFFKQWGKWAPIHELRANEPGIKGKQWCNFDPDTSVCKVGKKKAGRILDGRTWDEFPSDSKGEFK